MKIVVCVKYVPDAQADRRFAADSTVDREGVDGLLSELDEYAVEEALTLAENIDDTTVTVLTIGPDGASDAIRRALQMGADAGIHVEDSSVHGSCAWRSSMDETGDRQLSTACDRRASTTRGGLHERCPPGRPRRALEGGPGHLRPRLRLLQPRQAHGLAG